MLSNLSVVSYAQNSVFKNIGNTNLPSSNLNGNSNIVVPTNEDCSGQVSTSDFADCIRRKSGIADTGTTTTAITNKPTIGTNSTRNTNAGRNLSSTKCTQTGKGQFDIAGGGKVIKESNLSNANSRKILGANGNATTTNKNSPTVINGSANKSTSIANGVNKSTNGTNKTANSPQVVNGSANRNLTTNRPVTTNGVNRNTTVATNKTVNTTRNTTTNKPTASNTNKSTNGGGILGNIFNLFNRNGSSKPTNSGYSLVGRKGTTSTTARSTLPKITAADLSCIQESGDKGSQVYVNSNSTANPYNARRAANCTFANAILNGEGSSQFPMTGAEPPMTIPLINARNSKNLTNCYGYAVNSWGNVQDKIRIEFADKDGMYKPQPDTANGGIGKNLFTWSDVDTAVKKDGLKQIGANAKCPVNHYKIFGYISNEALVFKASDGTLFESNDYHWVMQNRPGMDGKVRFSHKAGVAPATNVDAKGRAIVNPLEPGLLHYGQGRWNYDFKQAYCVPCNFQIDPVRLADVRAILQRPPTRK